MNATARNDTGPGDSQGLPGPCCFWPDLNAEGNMVHRTGPLAAHGIAAARARRGGALPGCGPRRRQAEDAAVEEGPVSGWLPCGLPLMRGGAEADIIWAGRREEVREPDLTRPHTGRASDESEPPLQ